MQVVEQVGDLSGLTAWLGSAVSALRAHVQSVGDAAEMMSWDLRHGVDKRGGQIQLWWHIPRSRVAPEMLWDYVNVAEAVAMSQDVLAQGALESLGCNAKVLPGARLVRPRSLDTVPMFGFHPQRFRALYPAAKTLINAGVNSINGGFTESVMHQCMQSYIQVQHDLMRTTRLRKKLQLKGRPDNDMMQLGMFFADFHHGGKQIFDFPPEMAEMFRQTDVDGIPLEAINLPYNAMYLHFGRQEDLVVEGGWAPDGAYVSRIGPPEDQVLQFCLTFAPADPEAYEQLIEAPEPIYVQSVRREQMKIGVGEAVDLVLSERIAKLRKEVEHGSHATREAREKMEAEFGMRLEDGTSRHAQGELELLPARHKAWVEMLRLVVNGMAYLSQYPEDWADQVGPAEGLPWSISSELGSGNAKRARKAQSRLAELGYTAIHFCGVRLRQMGYGTTPRRGVEDGEDQQKDAWTWVRGHWRRQAHGPQWSMHRLRWLMPFKRPVNSTGADKDDGRGHIYLVS